MINFVIADVGATSFVTGNNNAPLRLFLNTATVDGNSQIIVDPVAIVLLIIIIYFVVL